MQEHNDLSFSTGDVIEIIEETNADWWTGKVHGKQALFPASYVEKIPNTPTPAVAAKSDKPVYRPFGAAYHGVDKPPPVEAGTNSVGLQEAPGTEEKKSKFGKYGNTASFSLHSKYLL